MEPEVVEETSVEEQEKPVPENPIEPLVYVGPGFRIPS